MLQSPADYPRQRFACNGSAAGPRFTYRGKTAEAVIRPGHVLEEFVLLGAKKDKAVEDNDRLEDLKAEMAARLLPLPAAEIYDARLID